MRILVVDDQRSARRVLKRLLVQLPYTEVVEAESVAEAQAKLEEGRVDLCLLDIRLSDHPTDRGGLDVLGWLRETNRPIPAVMVTSSSELAEIREAMRRGAQDYVLKDELCAEMLLPIVEAIHDRMTLHGEVMRLRERVDESWGLSAIVGSSSQMDRLRKLIPRLADAEVPVLIRGETGTGKELVARAIHHLSRRSAEPFLAMNCSALPGTLIESMMFGHERGAFTGADRRMRGQLELAGGGTLLLDEIAEMPAELQAKLLRVLEERRFRPLGAELEMPMRARVLSATHVDIEHKIQDGQFREDLYYRLNVVSVELPPLRERLVDIPELVQSVNARLPRKLRFHEDALHWLASRPWPGNVRELRNAIERLALLAEDEVIDATGCEQLIGQHAGNLIVEIDKMARSILALPDRLGYKLEPVERAVLHHAIETCGGNKSAAARLLGLDRKVLERKWGRLSRDDEDES